MTDARFPLVCFRWGKGRLELVAGDCVAKG